jgi:ankyrin repeat protein
VTDKEIKSTELGTPMDWAIAYGQLDAAKHLLSKGCKINAEVDEDSNIPPGICLAISTNNFEMCCFLLDNEPKCY